MRRIKAGVQWTADPPNAAVEVWRLNWADVSQRVLIRAGSIGQVRRGRYAFVAEIRALAHYLGQQVGRAFQHQCDVRLGDGRCGINLNDPAWHATGSVGTVLRDKEFAATGLAGFAAGFFTAGLVEWTSGAMAGRMTEVALHRVAAAPGSDVLITLLDAPVAAMAPADGFTIRAGCDKAAMTCRDKFANIANFRGFPDIPGEKTVLRHARSDRGHDGGVL